MKASETNVLSFIGGLDKVFIIPPFQRNYEWSKSILFEKSEISVLNTDDSSYEYMKNKAN